MTLEQRKAWAEYFAKHNINFRFFSAELAREMNEARDLVEDGGGDEEESSEEQEEPSEEAQSENAHQHEMEKALDGEQNALEEEAHKLDIQDEHEDEDQWVDEESLEGPEDNAETAPLPLSEATRILTTDELESLFLAHSPKLPKTSDEQPQRKTQIGLVGYPNVGKSSSINALLGAKKVSVSATPGKTKHFQTIHLSPRVILCDCPGLVFPNFATTKAELVCNGVLPIDQLREYTGPATLVAQRIPQSFIEAVYGIKVFTRPLEEGGTGMPTGEEILRAYAIARGFSTQGLGQPHESRAARYILKDYVKGKLLFCQPPPSDDADTTGPAIDPRQFNRELYDAAHLPQKRRAALAAQVESALHAATGDTDGAEEPSLMDDPDMVPLPQVQGPKSKNLDKRFFAPGQGVGNMNKPFHHKYTEQGQVQQAKHQARLAGFGGDDMLDDDGLGSEAGSAMSGARQLTGRKARTMLALETDVDPEDLRMAMSKGGKKHFKANKKAAKKVRAEYE